jgi:tetratricopeptide (TPR) repeat protein
VFQQPKTDGLIRSFRLWAWGTVALFLLKSVASAQSVQAIDSEAHLSSMLCRNPTQEKANEQLLNTNAQLVNGILWNTLLNCASTAQRHGAPARSIEIYKLTVRVADRLNKPELVATTYYYLGRSYSGINDFENSIQAYETSRKLFEQAGNESSLIYVLADLGALYLAAEDYEKAQSHAEQSLAIAEQMKSSPSNSSLGPIEYSQARSLHTLGAIDLRQGNHEEALRKLGEAVALYERLNGTGSSYNAQMTEVLIAFAKVYGEMGQYGKAFSYLTRARQVSRSSGDQNTSANIMNSQASLFLEQEDIAAAQKYFNASLRIYKSLGNAREEARVLLIWR